MINILLLLSLLQPAPDPQLAARWTSSISAVVSWQSTDRACLYRNSTFVGCWDAAGEYRVEFGRIGPLDAAYRPTAGDVYRLDTGGATWRAPLMAVISIPIAR